MSPEEKNIEAQKEELVKQAKLVNELIQENIRLTNRDKMLVAEKQWAESLMRRWRWAAYMGILSFWLALFTPSIVRALFQYTLGRPV